MEGLDSDVEILDDESSPAPPGNINHITPLNSNLKVHLESERSSYSRSDIQG